MLANEDAGGNWLFSPYSGICEAGVKDAHYIHDDVTSWLLIS